MARLVSLTLVVCIFLALVAIASAAMYMSTVETVNAVDSNIAEARELLAREPSLPPERLRGIAKSMMEGQAGIIQMYRGVAVAAVIGTFVYLIVFLGFFVMLHRLKNSADAELGK